MSFKDEIEKVIQAEMQKLETRDRLLEKEGTRKEKLFEPMGGLLQEIAKSVDPKYLEAYIFEDHARLNLAEDKNDLSDQVCWEVYVKLNGIHEEKWWFTIDETRYLGDNVDEKTVDCDTEREAVEYLIGEIGKKIAVYRHHEKRWKKYRKKDEQ